MKPLACLVSLLAAQAASAETGYELWLRYRPVEAARAIASVVVEGRSPAAGVVREELRRDLAAMRGGEGLPETLKSGALVVGTPANSPKVARLGWAERLARLGGEGYVIKSARLDGHAVTVIASEGESGVLHGSFHFLRLLQTGQGVAALDIAERPRLLRRILNHWDNLDGSIERGYAGPRSTTTAPTSAGSASTARAAAARRSISTARRCASNGATRPPLRTSCCCGSTACRGITG